MSKPKKINAFKALSGKLFNMSYTQIFSLPILKIAAMGIIFSGLAVQAKAEGVYFSDMPYYAFKGRTPHVVLPLSVEFPIIGNAWRYDDILQSVAIPGGQTLLKVPVGYAKNYEKSLNIGLFNPLLCYKYHNGGTKYFYPFSLAKRDTNGVIKCDDETFSGSIMNWATHSTLDMLRYALTGGSRLLDNETNNITEKAANNKDVKASTVVRRANILPVEDHYFNQDTPSKVSYNIVPRLQNLRDFTGSTNWMPARFANNHRDEITFSGNMADVLEVKKDGSSLKGKTNTNTYKVNVMVCNYDENNPEISDALLRPEYCQQYGNQNVYKPVGVLQKMDYARVSLLSYLNIGREVIKDLKGPYPNFIEQQKVYKNPSSNNGNATLNSGTVDLTKNILGHIDTRMWGGVVRSPGIFLNSMRYNVNMDFATNSNEQVDSESGIVPKQSVNGTAISIKNKIDRDMDAPVKSGGASIINYINEFGYLDGYRNRDMFSELLAESIRYIGNYDAPTGNIRDHNQPGNISRNPLYFYNIFAGINTAPGEASPKENIDLLKYHADDYGFFTKWDWNKPTWGQNKWGVVGSQKTWDEPVRSVCEKDSVRLITLADTNNWRSTIRYSGNNLTYTSAFGNDVSNTIFKNKRLNDIFNEAGLSFGDVTGDLYSSANPTIDPGVVQNRNLTAALLGAANRYGIKYQQNGPNKSIDAVKVKSVVVDVGEAHFNYSDCHLYYAGILGNSNNPNQKVDKAKCEAFMKLAGAKEGEKPGTPADVAKELPAGYFFPSQPQQLVQMIYDAFKIPVTISGSFSAGTLGKYNPLAVTPYVENFQFTLNSHENSKKFTTIESIPKKTHIQPNANGNLEFKEQAIWGAELQSSLASSGTRNILLGNIAFNPGTLDNLEKSDKPYLKAIPRVFLNASLGFNNDGLSQDGLRDALIDYLRGNNIAYTNDSIFRKRSSMLGSTQNSTPVYSEKYNDAGRNIVYIGGNDGMLHAIDADSGKEQFSYIPYALMGDISETAKPSYQNKAMLETHPVVQKLVHAYQNPITNKKENHNRWLLAGGFGAGNKGIYALEVGKMTTRSALNPDGKFDANDVLFEFTDKDDKSVGHIIGEPEFSKIYDPKTGEYQNLLAITSGYNSVGDMYLYLLDITHFLNGGSKHAGIARTNNNESLWVENTNYYKVKIANTAIANGKKINENGFTTVTSTNIAGQTKNLYFGDLKGIMYKVDLSKLNGKLNKASVSKLKIEPIFNTNGRPITVKPNTALSNSQGIWVVFGTGRYLGLNDLGNGHHTQQSLVGFRDTSSSSTFRLNHLNQFVIQANGTQTSIKSVANAQGWYVDFANSISNGERMTTYPQIANGSVVFTTQSTGKFNTAFCGDNQGGMGSVNLEDGILIGSNFKFSNYLVGSVLILPPLRQSELNANSQGLDNSQTSVNRNGEQTPMSFITGITSDTANVNPNSINSSQGVIRQGTVSWREISR